MEILKIRYLALLALSCITINIGGETTFPTPHIQPALCINQMLGSRNSIHLAAMLANIINTAWVYENTSTTSPQKYYFNEKLI
jgi:hypothetical protein